jgi:hypothetical protein
VKGNRFQLRRYLYCILLKIMQLTCTAWVESLNIRDDGRRKTYRSCQKHESLSLHVLSAGRHLLGVSLTASLKSNLCSALTTQTTTDNRCIILHPPRQHFCLTFFYNWNISVSGHKELTVGFPQRKPLPRSIASSSVSISI